MFIQAEETPNPNSLKFFPGQAVLGEGTAEFCCIEDADSSPLAKRLFALEGIDNVLLSDDFLSVNKAPDVDWFTLRPLILAAITDHYASGDPVFIADKKSDQIADSGDSPIISQVKELLEMRVRPAVAMDGGRYCV